jgi:hypothetical protein
MNPSTATFASGPVLGRTPVSVRQRTEPDSGSVRYQDTNIEQVLRPDRVGNQLIVTVQAVRRRGVTIVAVGLIVAELVWKAAILRHFYFWQDDFVFFDRALDSGFSWQYLMKVEGGHLDPGPFACSWLLARISLYNWTLVSAVVLVILVATGLAMLRLLRTLFGNRPAILIPLVVYLFSPLTIPAVVWWSSAIETLPLQLATCLALDAHVRYARDRQARHLLASIIWLVAGLVFFEKAVVLPLLLLAVTAGFLTEDRLPAARWSARSSALWSALWSALVTWRRAWLAYAGVLALYAGVFAVQVTRPGATPGKRGAPQQVPGLVTGLIKTTFVPGALGGPWRWFPSGVQAFAAPPVVLVWLAVLAAATIVGVSIARRRTAWRAWAILAGWLALADLVPVIVGRSVLVDPRFRVFLPLDTHYVADAVPVLAICLGLAFWPLADQPDHGRAPQAAGVRGAGVRGAGVRVAGCGPRCRWWWDWYSACSSWDRPGPGSPICAPPRPGQGGRTWPMLGARCGRCHAGHRSWTSSPDQD